VEILEPAAVESHISRKTSEIWGTHASFPLSLLKTFPLTEHGILHLAKHKRDMRYPSFVSPLAFKNFSCNRTWVPHIPDFLWSLVGSANFMRLSFKERRTRRPVRCHVQEIRGISLVFREMWDSANVRRATLS
jgi:hypothetical protein